MYLIYNVPIIDNLWLFIDYIKIHYISCSVCNALMVIVKFTHLHPITYIGVYM